MATVAGPPRQQAVLGYLALNAGRTVSKDEIIDAVWGEVAPASATGNLHSYISDLRQLLAGQGGAGSPSPLVTFGSGYRLGIEGDQVDVRRFERDLDRAAGLARARFGEEASQTWYRALRLWRGAPLAGISSVYAEPERGRLISMRLSAIVGLAEILLGRGTDTANLSALAELDVVIEDFPLHQRLAELRMLALHRLGRAADALAQFERIRQLHADEFGIDPGRALRDINQQVLAGTSAGDGAGPASLPGPLPLFVGRDRELSQLGQQLDEAHADRLHICAIDGPPGVGKTSLAVEFARRVQGRFPDGCHFLDLSDVEDPGPSALVGKAIRRIRPDVSFDLGAGDVDDHVGLYRTLMAGKRFLLVLDSAKQPEQVRPLLPTGSGSMVVVTSRHRLGGLVARDGAVQISLEPLSEVDARDFLSRSIGRGAAQSVTAIGELAEQCGHLPRALQAVADRLTMNHGLTPEDLVDWSPSRRDRLLWFGALTGPSGQWVEDNSVAPSLSGLDAEGRQLFALIGTQPSTTITVAAAMLLTGWTRNGTRQVLDRLAMASLLDWGTRDSYTINPLLHAYAANLPSNAGG
jgi:DNA-binding SARP family transcriptional activator